MVNNGSGTVIPIRTAANTALPPVKTGGSPDVIAITPVASTGTRCPPRNGRGVMVTRPRTCSGGNVTTAVNGVNGPSMALKIFNGGVTESGHPARGAL